MISAQIGAAPMLALATPPPATDDTIPGLTHTPEWHRAQETAERAWLDTYMRWTLKYGRRPRNSYGGSR